MGTKITKPGRRQQCITGRMGRSIPIRMPSKPSLSRPLKPGKKQSTPRLKRVHINPKSNSRHVLHNGKPTGLENSWGTQGLPLCPPTADLS